MVEVEVNLVAGESVVNYAANLVTLWTNVTTALTEIFSKVLVNFKAMVSWFSSSNRTT